MLADPSAVAPLGAVAPVAASTAATYHTVLVDIGTPQGRQYLLTLGQSFLAHPDGRAVPDAADACDPGRALAAPPTSGGADGSPGGLAGGEAVAEPDDPPKLAGGPR